MSLHNLKSRLSRLRSYSKRQSASGFTLLELLIAMVVASIVVSGLLYLVVELLRIDRRESVLTQTQQDMQRAINYIADDVREAVYIYDDPSGVSGQISDPPASSIPILAFWRPDAIDKNLPDCSASPIAGSTALVARCEALRVTQAAYSLVIYYQKTRDSNANWAGESRLIRYELDKYQNLTDLTLTVGYSDPASEGVSFSGWTRSGASTSGTKSVLVDFVDDPSTPYNKSPLSDLSAGGTAAPCRSLGDDYKPTPSTATTSSNTSFFGCIRDPSPVVAGSDGNGNQDAYLFLRGSIDGAGGAISTFSDDSALPTLETRVLMRGVINKNPAD